MTTRRTPALSVEFATSEFEFSHGRSPRGYGSWAFGEHRNTDLDDVLWSPASTYADAKRFAKDCLRAAGATGAVTLWVLP